MDSPSLLQAARRRGDDYLDDLEEMVNVDCGSFTPTGVNRIADLCEQRLHKGGWLVDRIAHEPMPGGEQLGDLVIGELTGSGGPRVLLIGHMDTVFDEGTATERPFRVQGDRAYGPGVSDMKGGLLAGFVAIELLQEAGFDGFASLTFVCNPDEEIGSPFSGPVIRELSASADVALVLECARAGGEVVSARKGVTEMAIEIRGRAAHAGVEPEKGRSAVLEAAHLTVALHAVNGRLPGVSVNVGLFSGGSRTNVVPDRCVLELDLRSPTEQGLVEAEDEVRRICERPTLPDVEIVLTERGWHRPMERTDAGARLAETAISVGAELGLRIEDVATGGASDANTTASAGVPTLDGLGPVGGDAHARGEWLDVAGAPERIALLAALLSRLDGFAESRP